MGLIMESLARRVSVERPCVTGFAAAVRHRHGRAWLLIGQQIVVIAGGADAVQSTSALPR